MASSSVFRHQARQAACVVASPLAFLSCFPFSRRLQLPRVMQYLCIASPLVLLQDQFVLEPVPVGVFTCNIAMAACVAEPVWPSVNLQRPSLAELDAFACWAAKRSRQQLHWGRLRPSWCGVQPGDHEHGFCAFKARPQCYLF